MKRSSASLVVVFVVCVAFVAPGQDSFLPGGLSSAGIERIVPDTVVYDTEGRAALGNWEPWASVLGNSIFLIEATTFAENPPDPGVPMQRYVLAFQPVAGGTPAHGEAFFADDGTPYAGPVNNYRQNGNPGRVAGDARPGATNFIAGGETSLNEYPEFQSDDRWATGVVRHGRFASVETHRLDPAALTHAPLSKVFDAINGRLTGGDPQTDQINRLGGDLAALSNGNFLVVVEDRSRLHDPAEKAVVAAIFAPSGVVVSDSFVIAASELWSNVAAFQGGFCIRVAGVLRFYDNEGELLGETDQADPALVDPLGNPVTFDRARGDGTRIAGHINSPYVFLAGKSGADVRIAVWDSRDGTYVAQANVNELAADSGGTDDVDFQPTLDRVNLAVDALNRVVVAYEVTPAGFSAPQTAARVLQFNEGDGEFVYLTPTFFPFANFTDGTPTPGGAIRTIRPSLAMTTRQICIAAKGEINTANDPSQGADTPSETNFYTVFAHPDPKDDPTPPILVKGTFRRGDVNADKAVNIADAISTLSYLFAKGAAPTCFDTADANDSGSVDIADAIRVLGHLFAHSGDLPLPFGACGTDPTDDALLCASFSPCQ